MKEIELTVHSTTTMSEGTIAAKIFTGMCLTAGVITAVYQSVHKKSSDGEKQKERLDDYSYRDLFHFFINPEFHWEKLHLAKEFSERMHADAAQYMLHDHDDGPDLVDHFTFVPYDEEKTWTRMDELFERLFKEKYLDWCDEGQPLTSDCKYYWWAQTKLHLITYLVQRQPYHLTDGIWLRGVSQGPMSSIDSKLFAIYIDELGNGDINQNHPNVYLNVLEDLGLQIPSIHSKEFVQQQQILDVSFQKPLLTLTTSLFPKTFQAEILGYTLWLETTSAAEHSSLRKIFERYNLNPKFSLLHTAIDNNLDGHGRYARDAVKEYLHDIRKTQGEQAVQEHWRRIWIGYVAYGTTGNIDEDLKKLFAEQHEKSPREEFLQLIEKKRPLAMKMHGTRRVGPSHCLLNELFRTNQCEALCDQLANSSWIVKGEPGRSPFLTHAVSFHGPMYQIFTSDELNIIARWIVSLRPSPLNDMLNLILHRRPLARTLSERISLKFADGCEQSLKSLFQGNLSGLLMAFRSSQWNVPSDGSQVTEANVHTCPLLQSMQSGGLLAQVFAGDEQDREIVRRWILSGCPIAEETANDQSVRIKSHENFQFCL